MFAYNSGTAAAIATEVSGSLQCTPAGGKQFGGH